MTKIHYNRYNGERKCQKDIILVSDSHRQTECLKEIREMYPNAYAYLHAGDSELPKQLTEGYACVQGNCDYYGDYETELICEVEDHRILLVHGHHDIGYGSLFGSSTTCKRARL